MYRMPKCATAYRVIMLPSPSPYSPSPALLLSLARSPTLPTRSSTLPTPKPPETAPTESFAGGWRLRRLWW